MSEKKRPAPPILNVPWILKWLASGYLAKSAVYRQELEAYVDYLAARPRII